MKDPSGHRMFAILKDLLSPRPATYLVVIRSDSILFARSIGTKFLVLHQLSKGTVVSENTLSLYLKHLRTHYSFYGQPMSVLIDSNKGFTHIKTYRDLQPTVLREQLQRFRNEKVVLNFTTKRVGSNTLAIIQGLDCEFLSMLTRELEQNGINVVSISTLSAYLALNASLSEPRDQCLHLISWSDHQLSYFGTTSDNSYFSGTAEVGADESTDDVLGQLKASFFRNSEPVTVFNYSEISIEKHGERSIAALFRNGHVFSGLSKPLSKTVSTTRFARAITTALNSVKLLLVVLMSLAAVAGLAAVISGLISRSDPQAVARYQELYARKSSLQQEIDSLKNIEAATQRSRKGAANSAALFSLFCQESYLGLSLSNITLKKAGSDSLIVEASGTARGESVIFRFSKDLNTLGAPIPVSISSFRPEVVALNGVTDTVLNFKIGMVIGENHAKE